MSVSSAIHNRLEPKALKEGAFVAGATTGLDDEDGDPALGKYSVEADMTAGPVGAAFTGISAGGSPSLFSYSISTSGFFGLAVRSTSFIRVMKLKRF